MDGPHSIQFVGPMNGLVKHGILHFFTCLFMTEQNVKHDGNISMFLFTSALFDHLECRS